MTSEIVRTTFEDRFYSSAKEQASKEFKSGFPLLRRVRASDVLRAIEIIESLPKADGHQLTLLSIRRAHEDAASRFHEAVTSEEEAWFGRYRASHAVASCEEIRIRGWNTTQEHLWMQLDLVAMAYPFLTDRPHAGRPEPLDRPRGIREAAHRLAQERDVSKFYKRRTELSPTEKKAEDAKLLAEWSRFKIDKKGFRVAVARELTKSLGVKGKKQSNREAVYQVPIGPWTVSTLVDFGAGRLGGFQLRYFQGIRYGDDSEQFALIPIGINTTSWLGPGVPHWNLLTDDDLEEAAVVLSILCSRFVEAAYSLVQDLDH